MAKKNIKIEPIKENDITLDIVGDGDLILHKKSRLYEESEAWKQNHEKGTPLPDRFLVKNKWIDFNTTINWLKPIDFHDDDYRKHCEEEWNDYMKNNRPCILTQAFQKSFKETFITFFKDSTGKNGTDFDRSCNLLGQMVPIEFASVRRESKIVPGSGKNNAPVVCNQNVFSGWRTQITIFMPEKVFPVETVAAIVQTSGQYIGIGSQRKNGYGRYHIENACLS